MCGRFFVDAKNREIDRLLEALPLAAPPVRVGEVFPTQTALTLALRENRTQPEAMSWGFPRWDGKGTIINARAETALQKPMFRKALAHRPLAIPATGFYEWKMEPQQKRKRKFLFHSPHAAILYLAGFWDFFTSEDGHKRECFVILTRDSDAFTREWHDRMPVILKEDELLPWLTGKDRARILEAPPPELETSPE